MLTKIWAYCKTYKNVTNSGEAIWKLLKSKKWGHQKIKYFLFFDIFFYSHLTGLPSYRVPNYIWISQNALANVVQGNLSALGGCKIWRNWNSRKSFEDVSVLHLLDSQHMLRVLLTLFSNSINVKSLSRFEQGT